MLNGISTIQPNTHIRGFNFKTKWVYLKKRRKQKWFNKGKEGKRRIKTGGRQIIKNKRRVSKSQRRIASLPKRRKGRRETDWKADRDRLRGLHPISIIFSSMFISLPLWEEDWLVYYSSEGLLLLGSCLDTFLLMSHRQKVSTLLLFPHVWTHTVLRPLAENPVPTHTRSDTFLVWII